VEIRNATGSLASYVRKEHGAPFVITSRGKPVAALVPVTNADMETLALSASRRSRRVIKVSRREWERKGRLSATDIRRKLISSKSASR
jgi:prevent-host-death family protein